MVRGPLSFQGLFWGALSFFRAFLGAPILLQGFFKGALSFLDTQEFCYGFPGEPSGLLQEFRGFPEGLIGLT